MHPFPRRPSVWTLALLLFLVLPLVSLAQGQDGYLNVESPQVHPIEVARVSGHDYILAVNTPDNSVEIWNTDETVPVDQRLVARVRVGLEPVSVRWVPELGRFYTANFLGDSISVATLTAGGGPSTLAATLERTEFAGDEPQDLVIFPVDTEEGPLYTVVVTQRSPDGYGWFDALTLQPMVAGAYSFDTRQPSGQDIDGDGLDDDVALKEPRAAAFACGNVFLLGEKGGNTPAYDADLLMAPVNGGTQQLFGGLGSTNFKLTFDRQQTLYAVGGMALNTVLRDEPVLQQAPTGFVEHRVYRMQDVCSGTPTIDSRDLNVRGVTAGGDVVPVGRNIALAQPTDLVLFEPDEGTIRLFLAAYGSDRLGVLQGQPAQALTAWQRRTIDIRPGGDPVVDTAGPRGLALKRANPSQTEDPGARLYVLNRISHSITIVDPISESVVDEFDLSNDPTPFETRDGRRFLYSARFGNGFNSCASCHIDARLDGIAWDLGTPDADAEKIPPELFGFPDVFPEEFPLDKEHMVTQSLQGLLNFDVEPEIQDLVTNAPYHWRADRATFLDFNGAFVGLLGGPKELDDPDMVRFETFINTVSYPGNPRQPLNRDYSGDFLGQEGINSTGATLGMVTYHIIGSVGTTSCVHCHALPEGSNNVLTEFIAGQNPHDLSEALPNQPMETAALRGLFQKEARLSRNGSEVVENQPITGLEGLFHTGFVVDTLDPANDDNATGGINSFVRFFFNLGALESDTAQYVHELDWGVGPSVGLSYTADSTNVGGGLTGFFRTLLEGQALEANSGFAVQARLAGLDRGFYFDPTLDPPAYREEPGGTVFDWPTLSALVTAATDRLVFIGTPLGSERRVAHPTGQPLVIPGVDPSAPELLEMVPNTANVDIPKMAFNWAGATNQHGGASPHITRLLQYGLIQSSPAGENAFGLGPVPRHDPPRRFRVAAADLRPGAELHLFVPVESGFPGAVTTLPPSPSGPQPTRLVRLPLHPTADRQTVGEDTVPIWETAAELDSIEYYTLMLGGNGAPGVATAKADHVFAIPEPPTTLPFDANSFNWHYVRVTNADGTSTDGGWQRLRITP